MNYFAHGCRFVHDPYFLAGTAVPDLLNVADRGVRARSKHALLQVDHDDPRIAAVARGIVQHHSDDARFHENRAFAELCWQFTVAIRDHLPPDDGLRPSFLGHILVEILLDAVLIAETPELLEDYYRAMESVDPAVIQSAVNQIAARPTDRLAQFIPLFCAERFLPDYADDGKLMFRLNQVMRRVRLAPLPPEMAELLPAIRRDVAVRRDELLAEVLVGWAF